MWVLCGLIWVGGGCLNVGLTCVSLSLFFPVFFSLCRSHIFAILRTFMVLLQIKIMLVFKQGTDTGQC